MILTYLDYTERKIALTASSPTTKRYIMYQLGLNSERGIIQNYCLTRWTDRKILLINPFFETERTVFVPPRILSLSTSRTLITPTPDPCLYERYCTFIPGAQCLTWTGSIILAFKYIQERRIYVEQDPISNRFITFPIELNEERYAWAQCSGDSRVFTPLVHLTIESSSERTIYYEIIDKVTQRQVVMCIEVPNERIIWLQIDRLVQLYTPTVKLTIAQIYDERYCVTSSLQLYSERHCYLVFHPTTERFIVLAYTGYDERLVDFAILQSFRAFSFNVAMAVPVPTERMIIYVPIIHHSERCVWPETRDLHKVKLTNISSNVRVLQSVNDSASQFLVKNERDFEIHVAGQPSKYSEVGKVAVSVSSVVKSIELSMVDNKGASITQDISKVKPITHLTTGTIRLGIIATPSRTERLCVYSAIKTHMSDRNVSITLQT